MIVVAVLSFPPPVGLLVLEFFPFVGSWLRVLWPMKDDKTVKESDDERFARVRLLRELRTQANRARNSTDFTKELDQVK